MWCGVQLLALLLAFFKCYASEHCDRSGPRVDCGYSGINQDVCEGKGCCWMPADFGVAVDLPWCFHLNNGPSTYNLISSEHRAWGGLKGTMQLSQRTQKELGRDIEDAAVEVQGVSDSIVRVKIQDARQPRWEIPPHLFKSELLRGASPPEAAEGAPPLYTITYSHRPFSLTIRRREPAAAAAAQPAERAASRCPCSSCPCGVPAGAQGRRVFETEGTRLVFKDQYLELTTWVDPAALLYGAGERSSATLHLRRDGMPLPIWAHDLGPTFLEQNSYGAHPFVMAMEEDGTSWGALLFNSNGMDIVAREDRLSWRATGGVIDLFVFLGPTPLAVMDQLTQVVGRPAMMPHWALGFHQSKYGYKSVWEVEQVVSNYSAASLPLEAIWTDIDHLDAWKDFTFNPETFPVGEMQRFVSELHGKGQRWVPIVDPGIKVEPGYPPYDRGLEQGVFMKGVDGGPYLGWVWPGACHYPDFFNPRATAYLSKLVEEHHSLVPWDGIWIDMNEVSNFCTGDVCHLRETAQLGDSRPPWECQLDCEAPHGLTPTQKGMLHPPYKIANYLRGLPLGTKAMSVLAYHHDGTVQYNSHNLYGLSEMKAMVEAVERVKGKRPFVLSRASFTGLGAYGAHWSGDNAATWHDLAWSIPGILSMGLFGMPMGGADVCGFKGDTSEELCARWIAAAAFQPFTRNHADMHSSYQELYRWPLVAATGRTMLGMRYRLIPYLYTAFHTASRTGAPVMRPLFMNFPLDRHTHANSRQFMVGDALLVTPVLTEGATSVKGYFPAGLWYSIWNETDMVDTRSGGQYVTLDAPLGSIPVHVRGGSLITMQEPGLTTSEVKKSPLTVVVALPSPVAASDEGTWEQHLDALHVVGTMYNDDGESIQVETLPCSFLSISFFVHHNPFVSSHSAELIMQIGETYQGTEMNEEAHHTCNWDWPHLGTIKVLGWQRGLQNVRIEQLSSNGSINMTQINGLKKLQGESSKHYAHIIFAAEDIKLECPSIIRLTWASSDPVHKVVAAI